MRYLKDNGLLIILTFYMIITINLNFIDISFYTNILNPLFWACILIYLTLNMKDYYIRFITNKKYIIYMFIISCIHIIIYFYLGFFLGFSKSPYNHDILSILKNVLIKTIPIISIEVTRCVFLTRNKNNKLLKIIITLLLILIEINYNALIGLFSNKEELFKYICSYILPLIACNCLYTYLTLQGSYSLPLIYRFFKELIYILLPILPDINWFIRGSICILSPTFVYLLYKYIFTKKKDDNYKQKEYFFAKISYTITFILCVSLISFMLGLFKYKPITILSNSMNLIFSRGDVVIFKKLKDNELKEIPNHSIIVYSIENQTIVHRVIKVIKNSDTILYQTKGDNNNAPDINLVQINQIKGIYVFHIKYLGFPSIWLYDYFHSEK